MHTTEGHGVYGEDVPPKSDELEGDSDYHVQAYVALFACSIDQTGRFFDGGRFTASVPSFFLSSFLSFSLSSFLSFFLSFFLYAVFRW